MADYHLEAPPILQEFLSYHESILSHSAKTVDEYFLDLRSFFRYLKLRRSPEIVPERLLHRTLFGNPPDPLRSQGKPLRRAFIFLFPTFSVIHSRYPLIPAKMTASQYSSRTALSPVPILASR